MYGGGNVPIVDPEDPPQTTRSATFPAPESTTASTIRPGSTTTGKSVQFTDDPPQSFSDTEITRPTSRHDRGRRRSGKRTSSPASDDSNDTLMPDPPPRTDSQGRPLRKDSVADAVEAFLSGRSAAGQKFNSAVEEFLGASQRKRRGSEGKRRRNWDDY
jgi:hypothetical protein